MVKLDWKIYAQKLKSLKFKDIQLFKSTFYSRYAIRVILVLILIWLGMELFFNWDLFVKGTPFSRYIFITQDVDSVRYLLSSAFQGLAALFALTISVSFIVAQMASSYSPRLVMKIVRKGWFIFGLTLFIVSLVYNLLLLSFVTNETVLMFKPLLLFGNVLDISSIIFIIPFVFLFTQAFDPWEFSHKLAEKFDGTYFEKMTKNREVDDTLPLFQTFVIKGIENGELDMVSEVLETFFGQIGKFITIENYHLMVSYFKPFFYKVIRKATENKENTILEQLIFSFEGAQNRIVPSSFMKVSKFHDEYSSSMPHMIIFLMNESIKFGDGEMLGIGFGALSRLEKKIVPLMPADDDISEIRSMKEHRKKQYGYRATQEQYNNHNIFEYIENVFLVEEMVKLAETAIRVQDEKSAAKVLQHIFWARYDFLRLDVMRVEVKKRIFGSLPYHIARLMKLASDSEVDIIDDVVTGVEGSLDELFDLEIRIAEYYISLMCDALMIMIKKEFFTTSPEFIFNMAGAAGREIVSKKNKEVSKVIEELIRTFKKIVLIIDKRSKETLGSEYENIRNEIASQLKSFQKWGLKEVDEDIDKQLGEFLAENWDKKFLKKL